MSGTPLTNEVPGWYINFQAAVLKQLPRPGQIDQFHAEGWTDNQGSLKNVLMEALVPPPVVISAKPAKLELLLEYIGGVAISATTGKFVAKEKFVVNTKRNALVKISYLGDNMKAWFLNGDGKNEDPISEQTLRYHKLRQSSMDGPIIAELGGAGKSETTLSEMFSLMEKQKHGGDGVLLNNGWANIFYIKDCAGVLRSVRVYWFGVGWSVSARSVEIPHRWLVGYQVFSRNSDLKSSEPSAPAQA